jgi:hypothetical protein
MSYNPSADDALIFQANQAPDDTDTTDEPEDPSDPRRQAIEHHKHRRFDYPRRTETPCVPPPARPIARIDPDPKRLNGKRLTKTTIRRDRDMLEN